MKKIFILVDYQKDFVDGVLGFLKAMELDKKIAKRVHQAYENNEAVICTMDTHYANYLDTQEGKNLPVPHCLDKTLGWEVYGETGKALNNPIYVKKVTFGGIGLKEVLEGLEVEDVEIELCGVITNMCVISTAVICKSILPEAKIIINAELCASFNDELHDQALNVMESMQMQIIGRN